MLENIGFATSITEGTESLERFFQMLITGRQIDSALHDPHALGSKTHDVFVAKIRCQTVHVGVMLVRLIHLAQPIVHSAKLEKGLSQLLFVAEIFKDLRRFL